MLIWCHINVSTNVMKQYLRMSVGLLLLGCLSLVSLGQARQVNGKVTAQDGSSLPGVTILVKGTKTGTFTNNEGAYTISVSDNTAVLVFKYAGYVAQEIPVGDQKTINVTLSEDIEELGKVVVAQAKNKLKRAVGYSTASVSSDEINQAGERSPLNALQGKVAGVDITQTSSDPGSSSRIVIRGEQSLTQNNQPLIVVDGVPLNNTTTAANDIDPNNSTYSALNGAFDFGNGINTINPEDIENISILKGSAATALYGSRGANGVVMITTKKGSGGKGSAGLGISYSGNMTWSTPLRLPNLQNTFGQGWDGNHWLDENGSWGPKYDGRDRLWGRVIDNSQLLKPHEALESNVRDFFETGLMVSNHVALSGSNQNSSFYASFSNNTNDGIYPTDVDKYRRNTVSLRAGTDLGRINVSASMNYTDTKTSAVPTGQGSTTYNNIMQIPRDLSIVDMEDYLAKFYNPDDYFTPYGVTNPYWSLNEDGAKFNGKKFFGNLETNVEVLDWLNFVYRFGYDIENTDINTWRAILLPEGPNSGSVDDPGFVSETKRQRVQLNHDFLLNFEQELNQDLLLDGFVGANINGRSASALQSSVSGLDIPGFYRLSNSSSTPVTSSTDQLRRYAGLFVQLGFNYKNYLFLNLSGRNDWSSSLPEENRSYSYGGANLSFVLTDVITTVPRKYLSFAKLRAAYGVTGNDAPLYAVNSVYVPGSINQPFRDYLFPTPGGVNGFEVGNQIGNPELGPEKTAELELGSELRFWDNRIGVDYTWYNRITDNQIFVVPIAPSSGYTNQVANTAKVQNQGHELLVTFKAFRAEKRGDFNWNISWNFTKNNNEVLELPDGVDKFSIGGLSTIGFFAVQGQPMGVYEVSVPKTNDEGQVVVDANGVPIEASEKELIANAQRDYIMGLINQFSYKGFSLVVNFDYRKGGYMFSRTVDITSFTGNGVQTLYNDRRPFVYPNSVQEVVDGDGNVSYVENTIAVDPAHMDDYHRATAFDGQRVIDKTFLKLRELSLTYQIPSAIAQKLRFQGMSVSFIGRNLFLWTPEGNQWIDPEVSSFGTGLESLYGEFSANPTTRSFGVSLRANL